MAGVVINNEVLKNRAYVGRLGAEQPVPVQLPGVDVMKRWRGHAERDVLFPGANNVRPRPRDPARDENPRPTKLPRFEKGGRRRKTRHRKTRRRHGRKTRRSRK